ncbi:hypothetical protein BOX15_Mlig015794g1, partial [Macrostomum lignano]
TPSGKLAAAGAKESGHSLYWTAALQGCLERVNHAAVLINSFVYSFGGFSGNRAHYLRQLRRIDVQCLNVRSLRWTDVTHSTRCYAADQPEVDQPDKPLLRYGHTVVQFDGCAYMFGGRNDRLVAPPQVCQFDPISLAWTIHSGSGQVPPSRDGHSACVVDNRMFIFGGFTAAEEYENQVYCCDLINLQWTRIRAVLVSVAFFGYLKVGFMSSCPHIFIPSCPRAFISSCHHALVPHTLIFSYSHTLPHTLISSYPRPHILIPSCPCPHALIPSYSHALMPSYPHALIPSYSHALIPSYSHILIPSCPHILIPSYPHILIFSYPHALIFSYPHALMPSYPHTLIFSYPHVLMLSYPHILIPSCPQSGIPEAPSPRDFSCCVAWRRGFFLWGGRSDAAGHVFSGESCYDSSIYYFDADSQSWSLRARLDNVQGRRSGTMFRLGERIYFGFGFNDLRIRHEDGHLNDLWCLDPCSGSVTRAEPCSAFYRGPCPRRRLVAVPVSNSRVILFGGTCRFVRYSFQPALPAAEFQRLYAPLLARLPALRASVDDSDSEADPADDVERQESGPQPPDDVEPLEQLEEEPDDSIMGLKDLSDMFVLEALPSLQTLCALAVVRWRLPLGQLPVLLQEDVLRRFLPNVLSPP